MGSLKILSLLFSLFLFASVSGCFSTVENDESKQTFGIGIHGSLNHINVFTQMVTDFWSMQRFLFASLLRQDPQTGELKPYLAESWQWSSDKMSLKLQLRPHLKWSDGKTLTAEDVQFTFEAHEDPEFKSLYMGMHREIIEKIEVIDPRTIRFHFKSKSSGHLKAIGLSVKIYPKHIYRESKGGEIQATSGPYTIKQFSPGKSLLLEKNPKWFGQQLPELKNWFNYKFIKIYGSQSEKQLVDLFKSGKVHFFQSMDPQSFYKVSDEISNNENLVSVSSDKYLLGGFTSVTINHRHVALSDEKVRKALMYMFNRKSVNQKLYRQKKILAVGPWPLQHPLASQGMDYEFSTKTANLLLEGAGWMDFDKDGVREKKVFGKVHKLSLRFMLSNAKLLPLVTLFKESGKKVGVEIDIRQLGFSESMRILKEKDFDLHLYQAQWISKEPQLKFRFFSKTQGNPYLNVGGFEDPQVDKWILELEKEWDSKKKKEIYNKIYNRLAHKIPDLFWFDDRYINYFVHKKMNRPQETFSYDIGFETWSL